MKSSEDAPRIRVEGPLYFEGVRVIHQSSIFNLQSKMVLNEMVLNVKDR